MKKVGEKKNPLCECIAAETGDIRAISDEKQLPACRSLETRQRKRLFGFIAANWDNKLASSLVFRENRFDAMCGEGSAARREEKK